jgi:hypothetical protein
MATPEPELSTPKSQQHDDVAPSGASNFHDDYYSESFAADGEQASLITGDLAITEKKSLFSFIGTKEFWIVLILGYVAPKDETQTSLTRNIDKYYPFLMCLTAHSLLFWLERGLRYRHFRPFSFTLS